MRECVFLCSCYKPPSTRHPGINLPAPLLRPVLDPSQGGRLSHWQGPHRPAFANSAQAIRCYCDGHGERTIRSVIRFGFIGFLDRVVDSACEIRR